MIINYIVYNSLGKILRTGQCQDSDLQNQANFDEFVITGNANQNTQYIKDDEIADLPPKPDGQFYYFDYLAFKWIQDTTLLAQNIIVKRDVLLYESDWTQIPNSPLNQIQVEQWAIYRQELRDIPQQPGFPENVIFPTPPIT